MQSQTSDLIPQTTDNRQLITESGTKNQEQRLCGANLRFTAFFRPQTTDNRQQITDN